MHRYLVWPSSNCFSFADLLGGSFISCGYPKNMNAKPPMARRGGSILQRRATLIGRRRVVPDPQGTAIPRCCAACAAIPMDQMHASFGPSLFSPPQWQPPASNHGHHHPGQAPTIRPWQCFLGGFMSWFPVRLQQQGRGWPHSCTPMWLQGVGLQGGCPEPVSDSNFCAESLYRVNLHTF